jgi:hypothetical protein
LDKGLSIAGIAIAVFMYFLIFTIVYLILQYHNFFIVY